MFKFFFNIFRRSFTRQGMFQWLNIAGLAIGLTVVLLICASIFNEYSFDKSFRNSDRIYRMNAYFTKVMPGTTACVISQSIAPGVKEQIAEVETAVRIQSTQGVVKVGDVSFKIDKFCWTDEDFFRLFDTPFVYGSPETFFSKPNMVAISESQAKMLFGDRNPMGETIRIGVDFDMEVSAVYQDFPANSSFGDTHVVGYAPGNYNNDSDWGSMNCETFCMLVPGANAASAEGKIQELFEKHVGTDFGFRLKLQEFERIHLYSKDYMHSFTYAPGDIGRIKMLALLAAIILLVACINYMNLSTARAQKRSKEIGISKTIGAKRKDIILRLYAETGMLTFVAFAGAFVLTALLMPVFNSISGQYVPAGVIFRSGFLAGAFAVYLLTTLVAASYPALYLSGFAPLTVIRQSTFAKGSSHALVRKGLTVLQFSVAVVLIAWVIVIRAQMAYVSGKDIGYDAQNVIGISLNSLSRSTFDALQNDYAAHASVSATAFSSAFPIDQGGGAGLFATKADMIEADKGNTPDNMALISFSATTPEIIDLLRMKLIAGKTFPQRQTGDTITYMVVNRKTVDFLGTTPEAIIGKQIHTFFGKNVFVCGVVEDFNFANLHEPIGPYAIYQWYGNAQYLLLKVKEGNISQQLAQYEQIFKKHFPNDLFEVKFPDIELEKAYEADRQTNRMALSFSILAILVACMGVFGLTAFMAEQRTKEIGIRKVLGANVGSVVRLFTDSYVRLLLISLVIAIPVAWWVGNNYLQDFAYRISLVWWIFAAAAVITIVLTLLTVCFQAIKAATANPVKAIKSE